MKPFLVSRSSSSTSQSGHRSSVLGSYPHLHGQSGHSSAMKTCLCPQSGQRAALDSVVLIGLLSSGCGGRSRTFITRLWDSYANRYNTPHPLTSSLDIYMAPAYRRPACHSPACAQGRARGNSIRLCGPGRLSGSACGLLVLRLILSSPKLSLSAYPPAYLQFEPLPRRHIPKQTRPYLHDRRVTWFH